MKIEKDNGKWNELEDRRIGLITSDKRLRQEQSQLTEVKRDKSNALIIEIQKIGTFVKEPYQVHSVFDESLRNLMQNMQTLKLPKTTAREFFRELSDSSECICGRPIGHDEKEAILKRADNYLGEDELNALNAIKDKLRNYKTNNKLENSYRQMVRLTEDIQEIQGALDRLVLQLDEEAMREAESIKLEQLQIKRRIVENELEQDVLNAPFGAPDATEQTNIALADKLYNEAYDNLLRATGTFEYTQKANKMILYIEDIREMVMKKLKHKIIQKTNEKIERIITDEKITVERIDGSLILHDRSAVSEGQTLAIAYAYIGSLFEHSSFDFPFVIDSPAASMDLGVRREVATIIPTLFKQLIIFITSGEVAGFAERFYSLEDVTYITIEGKDDERALCVSGRDFFSSYQSEEEE